MISRQNLFPLRLEWHPPEDMLPLEWEAAVEHLQTLEESLDVQK